MFLPAREALPRGRVARNRKPIGGYTIIKITLPLPPKALHAHAKGHWRSKTEPTKNYRRAAYYAAKEATGNRPPRLQGATLDIRFFWPAYHARDNLNAAQSMKPAIDGCVDAGIIVDDRWTCLRRATVDSDVDKADPRVELIFTPADPITPPSAKRKKAAGGATTTTRLRRSEAEGKPLATRILPA